MANYLESALYDIIYVGEVAAKVSVVEHLDRLALADGGGIDYAERKMEEFAKEAQKYIDESVKPELKDAFTAYLEYVIQRKL